MAIKGIEQTFLYNHLNKSNALTQNISILLKDGETLTQENLVEQMVVMTKNFKFPLKYGVLDDFKQGNILVKTTDGKAKLPTALPFILTRNSSGAVVAIVNAELYGVRAKDSGDFKIDAKKLYTMMEGAHIARLCYFNNEKISSIPPVVANGSAIYSGMFARVLNKKYALNIDKSRYHKVIMLASKFFMINLLGMKDSDMVFNYAVKNCSNGNVMALRELSEQFEEENFATLETFIKALADPKYGLKLKDLTVRNYLESYITMYDGSALLALESFPYFVYNVLSVVNGAYINNQYALEDVVDTYGAKLYAAFVNMEK